MMNLRTLAIAATVAGLLCGGSASAQTQTMPGAPAAAPFHVRGDRGSDRNLRVVRRRLEALIDQMQRDQHDYDGHRVKAIEDLQAARAEIDVALRYDNRH